MDKGKFGTGEGLLWYGICARCKKQASVVRGAFSEAFGVKNRLLWYGRDIRYRKRPSVVRGAFSEALGTGNALLRYGVHLQSAGCLASPHVVPQKKNRPLDSLAGRFYAQYFIKPANGMKVSSDIRKKGKPANGMKPKIA